MAYWADRDPLWLSLSPAQKAAAMALMEANSGDLQGATNVLGAIYNRAEADRMPVERSVSGRIYQPTIEDTQRNRLAKIVEHPSFQALTNLAERRGRGEVGDWVQGATHFLAPEKTMMALEAKEPQKYRSWRGWTGFNPETGSYAGVVMRDDSHAFLKPNGSSPSQSSSGNKPMFDLASLFRMGVPKQNAGGMAAGSAGMSAGTMIPKLSSAASPQTDLQNLFGSLGNFAPGGQQGGNSDMQLASQAMQNAGQMTNEGAPAIQARQPDMTRLAQMLQQVGRLGTYRPNRGMGV